MVEALSRFGTGFLRMFERVNDVSAGLRNLAVQPMTVSTITFTGALNRGDLPIDNMRLAVELAEGFDDAYEFSLDCDATKAEAKAARRGEDPDAASAARRHGKRFRYQLPLKRNGKSVKLFHNGAVHVTGCTSPLEFLEMMQALAAFVSEAGKTEVWLVDFDIHLINTLFLVVRRGSRAPLTIAPGALRARLGETHRATDFDTERHPSVKIPLLVDGAKVATVCVFQTGSVSIMGAKRPEHVAAAYEMVCQELDRHAAAVCSPDTTGKPRTTTAKHALVLQDGYPLNAYSACQVP